MSIKPTRIPKLLALANGRACARCGISDGTVVAAHYQGYRSHAYGKGRGIKPHDAMAAHLCHKCHGDADRSHLADTREAHSQQFLLLVLATHLQLFAEGRIHARGIARCLLLELLGNAATLLETGEEELHHTAIRIAEAWSDGQIRVTRKGAMVGDFLGVGYAHQ